MRRGPLDEDARYDLDATDELPVLDLAAAAAREDIDDDPLSRTGDWMPLPAEEAGEDPLSTTGEWTPPAASPAPADEAIAALTSTLREKSFAIARLERELEAARAEAPRARRARPDDVAVLEQRLAAVERERLALAAQHDERRAELTAADEEVAKLRASLGHLQGRLADSEGELAAARHRLTAETARVAEQAGEIAQLTALLEARAAEEASPAGGGRLEAMLEAELRAVREELGDARLHAARLLEQLRWREAFGRLEDDVRAAGAAPAPADARIAELEAKLRARSAELQALRASLESPAPAAGQLQQPAAQAAARGVLPKRYLVRLDDASAPLRVLAQERVTVGRTADNDLQLDEEWMSRHHAVLRLAPDATVVEDCGSTNGVFVNGHRVRRELLRDGDELGFGKARFRFQVHRPGGSRD